MNTKFTFQNMPAELKKRVKAYAEKKFQRIEKLIPNLPEDTAHCSINSIYFRKHNAFSTTITLGTPKKIFYANEDSHDIYKTIDLSFDRIILQLRKRKELKKNKKGRGEGKINRKRELES